MRKLIFAFAALPVLLISMGLGGCGREDLTGHGCGQATSSALCGKVCTGPGDCGSGTYCGVDKTCTADCIPGDSTCPEGESCSATGQCVGVNSSFDGGTGSPFDRDGACAVLSAQATLEKAPVDVILVVDNSGSMTDEIVAIQNNINTNFAAIVAASGLDYRVILIARHGSASNGQSICITSPLSGTASCTPPPAQPTNTANFFHYSVEIGSHNAFDQVITTYNKADEFNLAPMGWSAWLRPNAHKTFLVITDDEATGRTFTQFDTQLLALSAANFGTATARRYTWHSILGLKQNTPATTAWTPADPLQTMLCMPPMGDQDPPDVGTNYQQLSKLTGGLRYPICQYANFDTMFKAVAQGVVASGVLACDFAVPTAPNGGTIDLNQIAIGYTPGAGGAQQFFKQAASVAACVPNAFYVENGRIIMCPATCTALKADPTAKVEVLFVCESTIL